MKRIISFVMVLIMSVSLFPAQVFATETETAEKINEVVSVAEETVIQDIESGRINIIYSSLGGLYSMTNGWEYYRENTSMDSLQDQLEICNMTMDSIIDFTYSVSGVDTVMVNGNSVGLSGSISVNPGATLTFVFTIAGGDNFVDVQITDFVYTEIIQSGVQFLYDNTLGDITIDGKSVLSGSYCEVPDAGVTLTADAKDGVNFLGWIDENGKILSANKNYKYQPTGQISVKAAFTSSNAAAWFYGRNKTYLFDDLNEAAEFASTQSSGWNYDYTVLVLAASGKLDAGTYTIPSKVKVETKFVKGSFCKELQLLHIKYSGSYK